MGANHLKFGVAWFSFAGFRLQLISLVRKQIAVLRKVMGRGGVVVVVLSASNQLLAVLPLLRDGVMFRGLL